MKQSIELKIFKNYKQLRKKLDGISGEFITEYYPDNPNFGPLVLMPLAQKFKMPIKEIKKIIAEQRHLAKLEENTKQKKLSDLHQEKTKRQSKYDSDFRNYMNKQEEIQRKKNKS